MIRAGTGPCNLNGNRLYFEDSWEGRLKEIGLQQSRAANEVYSYQQLNDIGIPTLKPLVLGEMREFGRLIAACVVDAGGAGFAQPG